MPIFSSKKIYVKMIYGINTPMENAYLDDSCGYGIQRSLRTC
jgi:hypothetical protein